MRDWCGKSRCLTGHHGQQQLRDDASRLFECDGLLSAMGEGYRGEEWGGGRREEGGVVGFGCGFVAGEGIISLAKLLRDLCSAGRCGGD